MSIRVLGTISRRYRRWSVVREVCAEILQRHPGATLVHGDCPDGDRQLAGIWKSLGGVVEPHPADWSLGRHAGLLRSAEMVELDIQLCVEFNRNNSRGARYCADLAEGAGIPTVRYTYEEAV